ncbi:MAG: type I-E CRISPR-associated protein Cas7/Cse4/CasC [Armatimonadota bacterium]
MGNKTRKLFMDFHVIQTVPPSCVNRDDTGSPKTAIYGGVRRARVSSQCWKRAMREMFRENFGEDNLGIRTKKVVDVVAGEIMAADSSKSVAEAEELAEKILNAAAVTTKDKEAKALFFLSKAQAKNLASLAVAGDFDKKYAQAALKKGHGVDIALFGRMVADDPSLNVDASAQVAHSISTHRVDNEYDYFTAVDDRAPMDNPGAGMIGTVEFNSATLYRYATVAVHEFGSNLGDSDVTAKAIAEFARAFIKSMPTGKQNTFANRSLPDAVVVALRADQPINFSGAFEKPVKTNDGFKEKSIEALGKYASEVYTTFAKAPEKSYCIGITGDGVSGVSLTIDDLCETLYDEAKNWLDGAES